MRKNKPGRPPKLERKEKIRKLREAGYSYTEIAEIENLTKQGVKYHLDTCPQVKVK